MAFQKVPTLDELWSGEMMAVECGGKQVLLVNVGREIRAYEDACPHLRTRLSEGLLEIACSPAAHTDGSSMPALEKESIHKLLAFHHLLFR